MKKVVLVAAAAVVAGGVYYLSRVASSPSGAHVQGAIGGRRLAQGAHVCVVKLQNLSGKQLGMEGMDADLAAQLNRSGFRGTVGEQGGCDGSVYGEIISLKGKDRVEAEVEFRLLLAGDKTPYLSSIAKGKSAAAAAKDTMAMSLVAPNSSAAGHEAVIAAFADVARQIERQEPSRSTRASAE